MMSVDGNEPPQQYIIKNNTFGAFDSSPPLAPIPIIDLTHFSSSSLHSSKQQVTEELAKLKSALTSWGCFQAINHGISNSDLDKVREITKQFFALPLEEKRILPPSRPMLHQNDLLILKQHTQLPFISSMSETESSSAAKHVQELAQNIDKLPEKYVHKDSDFGAIDASCPVVQVPVIDHSLLTSRDKEELDKLRSALTSWGCFQTINHGIEPPFMDKVREVTKKFFALPMEEKKKYSRPVDHVEGYGNDTIVSEHQTLDWTDRLHFLVYPEKQRKLQYWPKKPEIFRATLHEYTAKARVIKENVLKAMARSLNLDENCFLNQLGDKGVINVRFNLYPRCPWPDKILGLKAHADGSAITILLQDKQVDGLQIMKDDQWFRVPIMPYALFINAGDLAEIMSNGIFKSPMHRVLSNSEKERMTVAMFCIPETEKEVGPVDELVSRERPRLYKNMTYSLDTYFKFTQKGLRPIDALKI